MTTRSTSSAAAAFTELRGFLVLGIAAVIAVFFAFRAPAASADFYAGELRAHGISENVVSEGRPYAVVKGTITGASGLTALQQSRILRLAWNEAVTERSPYMAIAGTDPETLRAAIAGLVGTQERLASMQKTPLDAGLVLSSLYPISFLTALADTEAARQKFLASGSDVDAREYDLALSETFRTYQSDLSRFKAAFLQEVPNDAPPYESAGREINKGNIVQALTTLSRGARTLEGSWRDRERCLAGDASQCAAKDLSFPQPAAPEVPSTNAAQLAQALEIRSFFSVGDLHPEFTGPLIELPSSVCTANIPAPPLFSVEDDGAPRLPLWYVGDLLLINSRAQAQLPFFKYFADHGVNYVLSSPLLYYKCLLNGYDTGAVLGVNAVIEFASTTPASAHVRKEDVEELARQERLLTTSTLVTQADAARYIRTAEAALRGSGQPNERQTIAALALVLNDRSAHFDNMLQEITSIENTNGNLDEGESSDASVPLDAPYLFYVRNGFASLFLAWNPSATGFHPALFPPAPQNGIDPFTLYSALPRTPDMHKKIAHDVEFYFSVHKDAREQGGI